jgi:hypothetical protein
LGGFLTSASGHPADHVDKCSDSGAEADYLFSTLPFHACSDDAHPANQGCQMAYLQTENPILGKFWRVSQWKILVHFMAICFILLPFDIFCGHLANFMVIWYIFPVLVRFSKKNLATLLLMFTIAADVNRTVLVCT